MVRSCFLAAWRHARRHAAFYVTNVVGLALGLAVVLTMLLFVYQELSYDRHHRAADRIYRVVSTLIQVGQRLDVAPSPSPVGPALAQEIDGIQDVTRIWHDLRAMWVEHGDRRFYEPGVYWADATFFRVFSHRVLRGNPDTMLAESNSVVLTESIARKYFGDADPIGQPLRISRTDAHVTGVIADLPPTSHITFDLLASFQTLRLSQSTAWLSLPLYTYVRLRPEADPAAVERQLPAFVERHVGALEKTTGIEFQLHLERLTDIHLRSGLVYEPTPTGDIRRVWLLVLLASVVLVTAVANYINIATVLSLRRGREVGVRRIAGATRVHLFAQFFGESIAFTAAATLVALGLVWLASRWLTGTSALLIGLADVNRVVLVIAVLATILVVSAAAGLYPALGLTRLDPARALKNNAASAWSPSALRKGLIVAQCAITTVFLTSAAVVVQQLRFVQTRDIGFDPTRVLIVPLDDRTLEGRHEQVRQALARSPAVEQVAACNHLPGGFVNMMAYWVEGNDSGSTSIYTFNVADGYVEALGFRVVSGRSFAPNRPEDAEAVMINETAARAFGWSNPIGKRIDKDDPNHTPQVVIGVVKDFHFQPLHEPIKPVLLHAYPVYWYLAVKAKPGQMAKAIAASNDAVAQFSAGPPPITTFLEDQVADMHRPERQLARITITFAALSFAIGVVGLIGLVSLGARHRAREIGVRRVMGASIVDIVTLLVREGTWLAAAGALLALPFAAVILSRWLQRFAYRIPLPVDLIVLAPVAVVFAAAIVMTVRALKAARQSPAAALRCE